MANVIKTVLTYQLDGSKRDFNVPFEYLARKFVVVTLIGVDRKVLTINTDYRFATRTTISLTKAFGPADGYTTIELRRVTSTTDRLVDFTDGSILRAYDLNVAQIQTMHVAEEARDLTADTIGVNNDGHLDARGRRIVNLANAVEDRDAVPFGQLKTMNQNSWQARNESQGFRNEAEQFRNQAEGFKNQAGTSAGAAANSATNAAHSEATAGQYSANASKSANSASNSAQSASTSEINAKNSELAAANSAAAASASEQNTKASASIVIQNISSYGSLPVGSVVATPINKAPAGFLKLDGSRFSKDTYPSLFEFLGTDVLPDWRNRYLKGALNDNEVGVLKGWGLPARTGTARAAGGHNHSGTTGNNGNHSHSGSTSTNGGHVHAVRYSNGSGGRYLDRLTRAGEGSEFWGEDTMGDAIRPSGDHSHSVWTNTTGDHNHAFTTSTVGDHVHSLEIPAMGTGVMDVDHAKVHWWIKAYGATNAEDMAKVDSALQDIKKAVNASTEAKTIAASMDGRLSSVENSRRMVKLFEGKSLLYGVGRNETLWYSEHDGLINALVAAGQLPRGTTRATVALTVDFRNVAIGLYSVRATVITELYTTDATNDANWYLVQASLAGHAANCERIMLGTRLKSRTDGGKAVLGFHIVGSRAGTIEAVGSYTAYASVIHY